MTTGMGSVDLATPRPWERYDCGDGGNLCIGSVGGAHAARVEVPADAALIVEAVNAYDRLRAIEAAARLKHNVRFVGDDPPRWMRGEEWVAVPAADFDALRAALDPATTEPKEPE